ncbi:hypothetical protein KTQ94_09420 [Prevotella stercorea]|uniref:hypothetical protein n=1 Tax=Leyella stercorea TaxID=363265 RepID=UPI001C2BFE92|nr:hypothetical protein [Leyella stercorea]MBU9898912.1 hypothetical protein [Leyella stercorea]MBU9947014.1 hypothetical protein [Leyella stercorea]
MTIKICVIAAALLLASPAVAVNSNGRGTKVKTVYQDTDPSATNYLKNRRALVGPGCTVNSVGDGVKVLSGMKNLQNICNDNLDDYAEFIGLADAAVAGAPVLSVKDNQHYYAGGMEAGFTICANSKSGLLSLDLASFFKIQFLKDGENVGGLCDIENAKNVTGIGLSLITIPGSDLITKSFIAKAPGDFDEIKLVRLGVVADALATFNVKYAFVGSAREYTITNNKENGISKYATDFGRGEIKLETKETSPSGVKPIGGDNVINEDLKDSYDLIYNLLLVATPRPITVVSKPSDNKETFPAGTEVGFKYNSKSLLSVDVAGAVLITLYDKDGNKVGGPYNVSLSVLKLGLLEFNDGVEAVVKSPVPFSSAKIELQGLKVLKLGAETVNYAFVRMAPDLATHHCPIEATASHNVCGCENEYQLQHSDKVSNITWSIVSQPADSKISLDTQTGMVSNIYVPGDYTFMATATADGCTETTTIHYAPYYNSADHGVTLLVNNKNEADKYALSDEKGGSLIQIFGGMENANAILTPSLTDFASTNPGIEIVNNTGIIGVKSIDGSNLAKNVATDHAMKVGFVVSSTATGLSAKALELYNIQLLKNGNKVYGDATTHWNGISAGLIGSEKTEKGRLSIDVPAGTDFDEIVLYSSGVLSANLDKLNVYYAYVSDETMENTANNALYGAEVVSVDNTDASIDLANTKIVSVATIGSGLTNMSNLIDNDMNTYMTFPLGVDLNGAAVMVNVGKIVNKQQNNVTRAAAEQSKQGQKIVLATNQLTLGLGVDLIKVLKVTTYLDDKQQEELTDWKVLGADVIGTGGKGYVSLVTTKPFNKLKIEQVNPVKAANTLQIGGIALTSNINEDGTSTDCPEEFLVLDEDETLDDSRNLTKATMVFHRTFTTGQWNSLILPVDMNAEQVKAAFGADAKIARFNRLKDKWIYFDTQAENNLHIEKNVPYIINTTKQPTAVNRTYNVGGENTKHINGLVYTVTGIAYDDQTAKLQQEDTEYTNGMTHYGSYENPTVVPADSYILHRSGDMVHTAVEHPSIKSYRTWLRETTPSGETLQMRVEQNDGPSTGIKVIEETAKNVNAVYNVSGMRMNSSNTDNLPKGVYIINNKKVVIK